MSKVRDRYVEGFKAGALLGSTAVSILFAVYLMWRGGLFG